MAAYDCWNSPTPVDQVQGCKRQHEYAFSVQEDVDLESVNPKRACQGLLSLFDPDDTSMDTDIQPVTWDDRPTNQPPSQPNIDSGNTRPLDANQNGATFPDQDVAVEMEEGPTPKQTPPHRFFVSGNSYLSPVLQPASPQQACGPSIGEMTHPCKTAPASPAFVGQGFLPIPYHSSTCVRCLSGSAGHINHLDLYH
ncbi:Hypp3075 [Branchiostoma lanceolatum]|uniref:Hypp3075 protein n=1 Tax=Branchiostoma lanceolatum TaxID=7740 RepID=A0A8J9ZZM5_BRALA|nr:Hypp3075 [Branchiostoma lanceolatum]